MEANDRNGQDERQTVFQAIGGKQAVDALVEAFYDRVVVNEKLAPLFAESEMNEVRKKQKLFLTQFLGGPPYYSLEYGHPMLRFRHMSFEITPDRAEAWLECMREALDAVELHGPARDFVFHRLTQTAHHMVNTGEAEA